MFDFSKPARWLYGAGIAAIGLHQLILQKFRPDILPPFPAWANEYAVFPVLAGIALVLVGAIITGVVQIKTISTRRVCLYLGFCFLVLTFAFQLPYTLIISPASPMQFGVWFGVLETVAYCGGAFVMAGLIEDYAHSQTKSNPLELLLEKLIPVGRIFFSILIILFGYSHFVFTASVLAMIPGWMGVPLFWTYLVGVLLICAGIAIIINVWTRTVALLLAILLILFFILFHIPDAIANPTAGGGNEIFRAIIALLFCGIALGIVASEDKRRLG